MIKISAILPSLNVVAYIGQCLESVCGQTLQEIEILCIDAGSTDGTTEIIQEYVRRDNRVKYIPSDQKSYGYQMNLGIALAQGEYVAILDTDDKIEPQMYQTLYEAAIEHDVDFVKADYREFCEVDGEVQFIKNSKVVSKELYGTLVEPAKEHRCFHSGTTATWSGIYKTMFLKQNKIKYNETKGAAYQDTGFWFQVYAFAKKGYFVPQYLYLYRRDNPNSSVVHRGNVFCICDEFEFTLQKLIKTERWDLVKDAFCYNFYDRYKWNLERIAKEFHLEFLQRMQEDFTILKEKGFLSLDNWKEWEQEEMGQILENPKQYYEAMLQKRKEFLDSLEKEKNIIIYGAGKYGKRLYHELKNKNNVSFFAVTGGMFHNRFIEEIPVKAIEQLHEFAKQSLLVITVKSDLQQAEMAYYARENGFERIVCIPKGILDFE